MTKKILLVLLVLLIQASCSFKPASGAAAQAMIDNGAFPGRAPEWITNSRKIQAQNYDTNFGSPIGGARSTSRNVLDRRAEAEKKQKSVVEVVEKQPLDKIIEVCPSIEQELSKALITVEPNARIKKYESLTRRCPSSADLWIWLGNDYLAVGDYINANSCALKAFSIDARSKEASELMEKAGKRGADSSI